MREVDDVVRRALTCDSASPDQTKTQLGVTIKHIIILSLGTKIMKLQTF